MNFEDFSEEHVYFYEPEMLSDILEKSIKGLGEKVRILDIGCGDCGILMQLINKGINADFYGLDISEKRVKRAKELTKGKINLFVGNAEKTQFKSGFFDFIICTQLIEHVKDDKKLVSEIYRLLKKNGEAYVTSVIKKPYGIYIYKKDGKFVSDPTHEREYKDAKEFLDLFNQFKILVYKEKLFKHPFLDLLLRLFIKLGMMDPNKIVRVYEKSKFLFWLRNAIKIPLIGFYHNEVLMKKD